MSERDNATSLFEGAGVGDMPHHSESFWTSVFAIFLLHLANRGEPLRIWERRQESAIAPWYWRRTSSPLLFLAGLTFHDISVEPTAVRHAKHFAELAGLPIDAAGIRPDVLLRIRVKDGSKKWVLIENKTTEHAQCNQIENYPRLVTALVQNRIDVAVLLLMSVGSDDLYKQSEVLQRQLKDKFGIILWEDVLRQMNETRFEVPGLPIHAWREYAEALRTDARWE